MIDPVKKRRRNIRLLIVAAFVLFVGGGLFTLYQINRNDQESVSDEVVIEQAREAFAEEAYDEVITQLEKPLSGNTITAIQGDAELLRMYITARKEVPLYNNQHLVRTIMPLKQLSELEPGEAVYERDLLETFLTLDRNEDALELAEQLIAKSPDDIDLLRQLAQAQLREDKYEEALDSLKHSLESDPLHVPTYAQILDLIEQYNLPTDPFITQAEQVYAAHAQDPRAMMIRSLAYETEGNGVQSRELLAKASAATPTDNDMVALLSQWLDQEGMYAIATQYIMQHAEPGLDTPLSRMAIYRAFESNDDQAILTRLKDSDPLLANADLLGMWANAHRQAGSIDQADHLLDALQARDNAIASTWLKLFELDQQEQTQPGQVIEAIVALLNSKEDDTIFAMARRHPYFMHRLGQAYLEAREPEAAFAAFSVAVVNSNSWPSPHLGLAETLIKLGQSRGAVVHAQEALIKHDSPQARQWLVLAMVQAANPNEAITIDRVMSEADKLPQSSPQAEKVLPATLNLLLLANRSDEAKQRLTAALDSNNSLGADTLAALMRLSRVHQLGLDTVIAGKIETQYGMTPSLALTNALVKAEAGTPEEGRAMLQQATPTPATKPWQTAMAEYLATQLPDQSADYFLDLADQYPDDLSLQLAALQANEPDGHADRFAIAIERLRNLAGTSTVNWRLQQARVKMQDTSDEDALRQAAEILSGAENLSPVHLELRIVLARCFLMLGENEAAAERAKAARTIASSNPQATLLHGMAMHRLKRYEESRLHLVPLINSPQVSAAVRQEACILLHEQGESRTVQKAIEQMRSKGQANNRVLSILAGIYRDQGQLAKADAICNEMMQTPDATTIRFVTKYYHLTNRPGMAEKMILAAPTAGISEPDALMLKANDAALRDESDTALALIEQAAELQASQPNRWADAAQLALSLSRPSDAIRFAKRGIEMTNGDAGLQALIQHAKLFNQIKDDASLIPMAVTILKQDDNHPQALRTLQITNELGTSEQAAIALEDLENQHQDFQYLSELAGDRLLRADLNNRAFSLASAAMARFNDSRAAARVATLAAYRLEDWTALLTAASAWAERAPQNRANADLMRAAALNKLGRFGATVTTLARHIKAQTQVNDSNRLMFEYYTQALVRTEQANRALQLLRPDLSTSPSARVIAIKLISEDLAKADTAAAWLKALAPTSSDTQEDRFLVATATFLAGQRLNDEPLVRSADQAVTKLLETPGASSVELHYAKGQIAQHLGNLKEAETSYRTVLAKVPDNPLLLNNLALVLADQGGDALSEAEQLAIRATQLSPKDPNLLDTLALIHLRRKQLDQAMKTIEKAIDLDESSPSWRLTQADIYEAMGQAERARMIRERYAPRLQN